MMEGSAPSNPGREGSNELVDEHRGKINRDIIDEYKLPVVPDSFVCISGDQASDEEEDGDGAEADVNDDSNK